MTKQAQMDAWLNMSKKELISECSKYGLQTAEKHIALMKILSDYLATVSMDQMNSMQTLNQN